MPKYDAWNRMVEVLDGTTVQANQYDGLNRRIVRTEGSDVRHFYYNNQWQVLTETDGTGAATAIYSYNPEYVDSVAVRMTPTDEHFYLHDANYNVTALVEKTSGNPVVERYAYTPYGVSTVLDDDFSADSDEKSDVANEYLYTGRRLDPATGLQLNRNRFYASHLGRWVNRDPIGYDGGDFNLYGYVAGMPTFWVDPEGLAGYLNDDGMFLGGDGQGDLGYPNYPPRPPHLPKPNQGPEDGPNYEEPIRCTGADSCAELADKAERFRDAIRAHRLWDKKHWPGRHAQEILEMGNGLQRCMRLYGNHNPPCRKPKDPKPEPRPEPFRLPPPKGPLETIMHIFKTCPMIIN